MYPKLKICSKIFDYKFDGSDSFYSLKTIVTSADMTVLNTSGGEWKSGEKLSVKKKK